MIEAEDADDARDSFRDLSAKGARGDGDSLHSDRSIMPIIPSRIAGLSVPETD